MSFKFNVFISLLYPIKLGDQPIEWAKFYGKIARKYKWFPLIHIIGTFILVHLLFYISLLFNQGIIKSFWYSYLYIFNYYIN